MAARDLSPGFNRVGPPILREQEPGASGPTIVYAGYKGYLTPSQVANLFGFFDFSDITTLFTDAGRSVPVTAEDDHVVSVTDKSGAGNHLASAGGGGLYKPALIGQRPGVRTDGVDDYYNTPTLPASSKWTVLAVALQTPSTAQSGGPPGLWNLNPGALAAFNQNGPWAWEANEAGIRQDTTISALQAHVLTTVVKSASALQIWADGRLDTLVDPNDSVTTGTRFEIAARGSSGSSAVGKYDIGVVLLFNAELSDPDRWGIEGWAANTYRLNQRGLGRGRSTAQGAVVSTSNQQQPSRLLAGGLRIAAGPPILRRQELTAAEPPTIDTGQAVGQAHGRSTAQSTVIAIGKAAGRARCRATGAGTVIAIGKAAGRAHGWATNRGTDIAIGKAVGRAHSRASARALDIALGKVAGQAHGRATAQALDLAIGKATNRAHGWASSFAIAIAHVLEAPITQSIMPILPGFTRIGPPILREQEPGGVVGAATIVQGQAIGRAHGWAAARAIDIVRGLAVGREHARATARGTDVVIGKAIGRDHARAPARGLDIVLGRAVGRDHARAPARALVIVRGFTIGRARGRSSLFGRLVQRIIAIGRGRGRGAIFGQIATASSAVDFSTSGHTAAYAPGASSGGARIAGEGLEATPAGEAYEAVSAGVSAEASSEPR